MDLFTWIALASALLGAGGTYVNYRASQDAAKQQQQMRMQQQLAEAQAAQERSRIAVENFQQQAALRNEQAARLQQEIAALQPGVAAEAMDTAAREIADRGMERIGEQASLVETDPSSGVTGRVSQTFSDSVAGNKAQLLDKARGLADLFGTIGAVNANKLRERQGLTGAAGDIGYLNERIASGNLLAQNQAAGVGTQAMPTIIEPYSDAGQLMTTVGNIGMYTAPYLRGQPQKNWWEQSNWATSPNWPKVGK